MEAPDKAPVNKGGAKTTENGNKNPGNESNQTINKGESVDQKQDQTKEKEPKKVEENQFHVRSVSASVSVCVTCS